MARYTISFLCFLVISITSLHADEDEDIASSLPLCGEAVLAFDTFRSLPDGSYSDNTGAYLALNTGLSLSSFTGYGIGTQVGGSYGVYDWSGRANPFGNPRAVQQQGFLTFGVFKKTPYSSGVNLGFAYDLMVNHNFGCFVVDATFSQLRFKVGYQLDCCDEFGFWGTAYLDTNKNDAAEESLVKYRAINQLNLFWEHHFSTGAETMIWLGVPYTKSLNKDSSRGFIAGASFWVPLNACWSIQGHGSYRYHHSSKRVEVSKGYGSNVSIGIAYTFGSPSACWAKPYLELADNSNFLSDTNISF